MSESQPGRAQIEALVAERARHHSADQVQSTCSFARAERLLGREYHGRFLIELLQNAADAWRRVASPGGRSTVAVLVEAGPPALVVANHGADFPASVVLESLGHIGRSTKAQGEAIGHKGIGFKSVLELSDVPELYSGLQSRVNEVSVRFDPVAALTAIRASSPEWDRLVAEIDDVDSALEAIPKLRFPSWVEKVPPIVTDLANQGFDTVIRLPWTPAWGTQADWHEHVRGGVRDVTDEILLLLGTFDAIDIDDRITGERTHIAPSWHDRCEPAPHTTRERVVVSRDGQPTSEWLSYKRQSGDDLSGETAVAVRTLRPPQARHDLAVHPVSGELATGQLADEICPFHLFFPTRIGSGLPLLLHGYFEVDAARTGFYEGSAVHNDTILDELAKLLVLAVADIADGGLLDLVSLVNLIAASAVPEDPHARHFRDQVLAGLDEVSWIPLAPEGSGDRTVAPDTVLVADATIHRALATTFPVPYIEHKTSLRMPHPGLSPLAHAFVARRTGDGGRSTWDLLKELMSPGDESPWASGGEDAGFLALVELVRVLEIDDPSRAMSLLAELRGDPNSRLIPVPDEGPTRRMIAIPDPRPGNARRRSTLVMARFQEGGGQPLDPPEELNVQFLPDGLLADETHLDRAKSLGVRPFTVDNILDRLNVLAPAAAWANDELGEDADLEPDDVERSHSDTQDSRMVVFLWRLLTRARQSVHGTEKGAHRLDRFDQTEWFWLRPGRGGHDDTDRDRQDRERYLSHVRLPARDGSWQPAGRLALGADWAEWIAERCPPTPAMQRRRETLADLELIAPDASSLLASPSQVLDLLDAGSVPVGRARAGDDPDAATTDPEPSDDEDDSPTQRSRRDERVALHRLAFLLGLGVWEVPPVEGFERRLPRGPRGWPWAAERERLQPGTDSGPWNFDRHRWYGSAHVNVYVTEDFRLLWPLTSGAATASAQVRALAAGSALYVTLATAAAMCPSCSHAGSSHRPPYRTAPDERRPSTLALQLQQSAWVPATLAGQPVGTVAPRDAWWVPEPPSVLLTSPLWHLTLADFTVPWPHPLRQLAGLEDLGQASIARLVSLLEQLRTRLDEGTLVGDLEGTTARGTYEGLHRLIYEQLADRIDEGDSPLASVGVLCELGERLIHVPTDDARHDDGKHTTYRHRFAAQIAFVVIPKDRAQTARRLGIAALEVRVQRRDMSPGVDVTDELAPLLAHRIPDLLAILVHHSLGAQTLDPVSETFTERARRLRQLRVVRLDDLVLDAEAVGTGVRVTIGEGSAHESFLEAATTQRPMVYHDMTGADWVQRFRRQLAGHLAVVVENAAYSATFALLLSAESEAERELVLHEMGIGSAEVDAVRVRIGAVTTAEQARYRVWFAAILECCTGGPISADSLDLDLTALADALENAGLDPASARSVAAAGGGDSVRSATDEGSVLWHLEANGVDLAQLDARLRRVNERGLEIRVAITRFRDWRSAHGQHLAAVLATRLGGDEAKAAVEGCEVPPTLRLQLQPGGAELVAPFAHQLERAGFGPDAAELARHPRAELLRICGLTETELDEHAAQLYDEEEGARRLSALARAWRAEIVLLALLTKTHPGETRASIRGKAETLESLCPIVAKPALIIDALADLLPDDPGLRELLEEQLHDTLPGTMPDRSALLDLARQNGLATGHTEMVVKARNAPRREQAIMLQEHAETLATADISIVTPPGLAPKPTRVRQRDGSGVRKVAAIKVAPSSDRRKRELGDEAERWALASVVGTLVGLASSDRDAAVGSLVAFLDRFSGSPVDAARAHGESAREPDLDEEDLIEELCGLVHVARHSDAFGFDMLGWLADGPDQPSRPIAVEVKNSADGSFLMSHGEWETAAELSADGEQQHGYAVLVVRRGRGGEPPRSMDLLPDPVALLADGRLGRDADTYRVDYVTTAPATVSSRP